MTPTDVETELSRDFYEESVGPCLQVATVANSKHYSAKDFEGVTASTDFTLLPSNLDTPLHWATLKKNESGHVVSWCAFDYLLVGLIIFDVD